MDEAAPADQRRALYVRETAEGDLVKIAFALLNAGLWVVLVIAWILGAPLPPVWIIAGMAILLAWAGVVIAVRK